MPMAFTIHVNILVLALERMINMKMIKARSLDSGDGDFDDTCILHPVWNILHATSAWKLGVLRVWAEKNILKLHKKKLFLKKKIFEIFFLQKKNLLPSILQASSLASTMGATTFTGLPIDLTTNASSTSIIIRRKVKIKNLNFKQSCLQNSIPLIFVGILAIDLSINVYFTQTPQVVLPPFVKIFSLPSSL